MLSLLDEGTLHQIFGAFIRRLKGEEQGPICSWLRNLTTGIWKRKNNIEKLEHWRWISIVGSLSKWYEWCWVCTLEKEIGPPPRMLLGFRQGAQPLDVVACLATWVRKAHEWQCPIWIGSVHVEAAFDRLAIQRLDA